MDRENIEAPGAAFDLLVRGRYIGDENWVDVGSIDMLAWEEEGLSRVIMEYDHKLNELCSVGRDSLCYLRFDNLYKKKTRRIQDLLSFSNHYYTGV